MAAVGYHHQIGLNTWESKGGNPPGHNTSGLYHFALNYPDRKDLAIIPATLLFTFVTQTGTALNSRGTGPAKHGTDGAAT
jgi:catechol 2,3-dioxygenase